MDKDGYKHGRDQKHNRNGVIGVPDHSAGECKGPDDKDYTGRNEA